MLQAIAIKNFKTFTNTGRLNLRPITLIYGENSSGKSSIVQSILLLKQSVRARETTFEEHAPLDFKGVLVDLGGYGASVHAHDTSLPLSFTLTTDDTFGYRVENPFSHQAMTWTLTFGYEPGTRRSRLDNVRIRGSSQLTV